MTIPIDEIAENIAEERCVVLLGPNVATNKAGDPLYAALLAFLQGQGLDVTEDVDGLCRCDEATRHRLYTPIKKYYRENAVPNKIHKQLAQIPTHLIISLAPDLLLRTAFSELGIDHEFGYYARRHNPAPVARPSKDKPLLYNLFGSIEDDNSLIVTHLDLIQFIFSIIRDFRLPDELRDVIAEASYFVFLGFDFEKWYLQVLLNLFHLSRQKPSQAAEPDNLTPEQIREFYGRNYGLEFVDSGVDQYVDRLHEHCKSAGLLREIKEVTPLSLRDELIELLSKGEMEDAIERISDHLAEGELFNDVTTLSGQYTRLQRDKRRGKVTEEEVRVQYAKMSDSLTSIVDEALPASGA